MALLDWSTTALGYPAHRISGAPVVSCSHMPTQAALMVAQAMGFAQGLVFLDVEQAHLEDLAPGKVHWVDLRDLFDQRRVAETEGMISGTVLFVPCEEGEDGPNDDRDLIAWAEETAHPWLRVIDNEYSQWGGLTDPAIDRLLCWFLGTHPADGDWRQDRLADGLGRRLRTGLFDHGWTRNGELVQQQRAGKRCTLWGGVHGRSVLDHSPLHALSSVQHGLALSCRAGVWSGDEVGGACPLDEVTGRLARRLSP